MRITPALFVLLAVAAPSAADEDGWIELTGLDAWKKTGDWMMAADAAVHPDNPRLLVPVPGEESATMINGEKGRTGDLYTKESYRDLELHMEFLIPERSNSGVKFMGLYEIQIEDTWQVKEPTGKHCGGIYPRAKLAPSYMYLDDGIAPKVNAARKPGEWQTLDVIFRTPRFGPDGEKIANAKIERATMNGLVIHENVELQWPTGHNWVKKEIPEGPLMFQADHGPVALRNLKVRPIK